MTLHVISELSVVAFFSKPFTTDNPGKVLLQQITPHAQLCWWQSSLWYSFSQWPPEAQASTPHSDFADPQVCGAGLPTECSRPPVMAFEKNISKALSEEITPAYGFMKAFCSRKSKLYSSFLKIILIWIESPALYKAQTALLLFFPPSPGNLKKLQQWQQTEQWVMHPEMNGKQNKTQLSCGQGKAGIKKGMEGKHNEDQRRLSTKYKGTHSMLSPSSSNVCPQPHRNASSHSQLHSLWK